MEPGVEHASKSPNKISSDGDHSNDENSSSTLSPSHDSPSIVTDPPTLGELIAWNVTAEYCSNEYLLAIILKAQPHHSNQSLAHLTRPQLIDHVDALIAWWKKANPRKLSLIVPEASSHCSESIRSERPSSRGSVTHRDDCCCIVT